MNFFYLCGMEKKQIKSALVSVYHKEGLDQIIKQLASDGVKFYSTGGTQQFIEGLGLECTPVETLTGYPSILGGRVKTLHPGVFGGILARRGLPDDLRQLEQYDIPQIDLVIVDLYPFEQTVADGAPDEQIIEKIDIGGISLIRAAAKNHADVVIVGSQAQYGQLLQIIQDQQSSTTLEQRRQFAAWAFAVSSHYDAAIFNWLNHTENLPALRLSYDGRRELRYGENPHQQAAFYGDPDAMFTQLWGKEVSYNNMLDIDAAIALCAEFDEPTFAILKHNNACGIASRDTLTEAWREALAADPVSAFGGVLICNRPLDVTTAGLVGELFFEVILAPDYSPEALEILKQKKNRIILKLGNIDRPAQQLRSLLGGVAMQERDAKVGGQESQVTPVTKLRPTPGQLEELIFANKVVKHSKSNAIVLASKGRLLASGVGQTSRVDALRQAVAKAESFGFDLQGAVMASDAFFPFADCVQIARDAGIAAVIQPGGSVRDQESIDYCDAHGVAMVFTGTRHFKH